MEKIIQKNIEISYAGEDGYIDINTFLTSQFHFLKFVPDAILYIRKPDHFPKEKSVVWNFIYEGSPIRAIIKSEDFIKKINDGERFGQGDALKATLSIEMEWDEKLNTFIRNGKYEISEVNEIIRRPDQGNLFSK